LLATAENLWQALLRKYYNITLRIPIP